MLEQVESAYDTVFPRGPADDRFFDEMQEAYNQYRNRTNKRPITPRDVKNAQRVFRDQCRSAMAEAKRRIQDA